MAKDLEEQFDEIEKSIEKDYEKALEKRDFRKEITEEIISHIEKGTTPWQKPWEAGVCAEMPHNPISNNIYHGINSIILEMKGYQDPRWLTYKQALSLNAEVKKGSKGTQIEYWKWEESKTVLDDKGEPVLNEDGKPKTKTVRLKTPKVFRATVFNAEQIEGLEPYIAPPMQFNPIERAEEIIKGTNINIEHRGQDRAFYSLGQDKVQLPPKEAFKTAHAYYATALHELGHATGHHSRLNRDMAGGFGSENYAKEELRAEISSYMIARQLGIGHDPSNHASYVESWLKALREDKHEIFRASKDATRIFDWILEPDKRPELERQAQNKQKAKEKEAELEQNVQEEELKIDEMPKAEETLKPVSIYVQFSEAKGLERGKTYSFEEFEKIAKEEAKACQNIGENETFIKVTMSNGDVKSEILTLDGLTDNCFKDYVENQRNWVKSDFFKNMPEDAKKNHLEIAEYYSKVSFGDDLEKTLRPEKVFVHWSESSNIKDEKMYDFKDFEKIAKIEAETCEMGYWKTKVTIHLSDGNELHRRLDLSPREDKGFESYCKGTIDFVKSDRFKQLPLEDQKSYYQEAKFYKSIDFSEPKAIEKTVVQEENPKDVIKETLKVEIFGEQIGYILKKSFEKADNKLCCLVKANGEEYAETTKIEMRKKGAMHVHKDNITKVFNTRKTYLDVPFEDKNEVKSLGAKWDKSEKAWYIKAGSDLGLFKKWQVTEETKERPTQEAKVSPEKEFGSFLKDKGFELEDKPVMDGKWQKASVAGDKDGNKSGAYIAFSDDKPNGQTNNFKTGDKDKWAYLGQALTSEAKDDLSKSQEEAKNLRREETYQKHKENGKIAFGVFKNKEEATKENCPYLANKNVNGYGVKANEKGELLVPARDKKGFLWNVQAVSDDKKQFIIGTRKAGTMHLIDDVVKDGKLENLNQNKIYITEKYESGATIHEATKAPVIVAFDAYNLKSVASEIRKVKPDVELVICANNAPNKDYNVSFEQAKIASDAFNAKVVVPEFNEAEKAQGLSDFNDLANSRGIEAVKSILPITPEKKPSFEARQEKQEQMAMGLGM